ncbi:MULTISPECIES: hypothetical protein [unclassified Arthrobacter]|uniref:hypothetical protein n=1 Tax=unclassified Arthrobacter TaxID=235627 RepID=UPI001E53EC1E|nr:MULTISPECIES: hypothetical protein [unclassified Arthrobacter]MCC9144579.1 hypothetical protein [Arthrobacter sp. zg-Y919]MDK1275805.1 hypothetical protein [Arthrobacter sp. zg.Y919]WIB02831.1 hypothetical protein QNO10_12945 [Arthrobacter sp. zg-Y919]
MRKTAAVPALALLFVTGCSAEAAEPDASAPAAATAKPSATAETVALDSVEGTCLKLLGTGGNGPLYQAIYFVKDNDTTFSVQGSADSARTVNAEVQDIAASAPEGMGILLKDLSASMDGAIPLAEGPGPFPGFDIFAWRDAVSELLIQCAPYETAADAGTAPAAPASSTADEASASFPGYPMIVNVASVDYRVGAWFDGKLVDGLVVALAPGLYAPYDPNVPDLSAYYVPAGVAGDRTMKTTVFPNSGGAATWSGVNPGAEEPQ